MHFFLRMQPLSYLSRGFHATVSCSFSLFFVTLSALQQSISCTRISTKAKVIHLSPATPQVLPSQQCISHQR